VNDSPKTKGEELIVKSHRFVNDWLPFYMLSCGVLLHILALFVFAYWIASRFLGF